MSKALLNDKTIRRPVPDHGQEDVWDTILPGFGLRLSAGGKRTFFVARRLGDGGKLVRRTLGHPPAAHVLKGEKLGPSEYWPADARKKAERMLADLARGVDPAPIRPRVRKHVAASDGPAPEGMPGTFLAVAEEYLNDSLEGGGARLANNAELRRKVRVTLAAWHARPIDQIKARDIRELVREKAKDAPVEANRVLSLVKRIFRWAVVNDVIEADPAAAVSKPTREEARERFLSDDEIRWFWSATARMGPAAGNLYRLMLVLGARRGEVAGMRRSEIGALTYAARDEKGRERKVSSPAWLIPAERMKRRKPHAVPLPQLARNLIEAVPHPKDEDGETLALDCVFATGEAGDQPPASWSKRAGRLLKLMGEEMAKDLNEEFAPAKHSVVDFHPHDLRATAATLMLAKLSVPRSVVSRVLHHAEGERGQSTTGRYLRYAWDAEAAEALDRWSEELARIIGTNVIRLPGAQVAN